VNPLVGSSATIRCPKCRFSKAKIALDTAKAIYYLCSACQHAWSEPKTEESTKKAS